MRSDLVADSPLAQLRQRTIARLSLPTQDITAIEIHRASPIRQEYCNNNEDLRSIHFAEKDNAGRAR